jgi:hypothetical protein
MRVLLSRLICSTLVEVKGRYPEQSDLTNRRDSSGPLPHYNGYPMLSANTAQNIE